MVQEILSSTTMSIIMPVYNAEPYIRKTLDAILSQTYKNWKLIAINDGSTDKSLSILEEYAKKDNRIMVFSQKNAGMVRTTRRAITKADTKYIVFADADDMMRPKRLEIQYKYMEEHPDVDVLGTCFEVLDTATGNITDPMFYVYVNGLNLSKIYKDMIPYPYSPPVHHPTVMMKRDVYEENKSFFRKIPITFKNCPPTVSRGSFADVYFYMLLFLKGYKILCIPDRLYLYRKSETSLLHANKKQAQEYCFKFLTRIYCRYYFGKSNYLMPYLVEFFAGARFAEKNAEITPEELASQLFPYMNYLLNKFKDEPISEKVTVLASVAKNYLSHCGSYLVGIDGAIYDKYMYPWKLLSGHNAMGALQFKEKLVKYAQDMVNQIPYFGIIDGGADFIKIVVMDCVLEYTRSYLKLSYTYIDDTVVIEGIR